DGSVLDVGRKTRTVPPALRRALDARDRGCRFPGCGLRFTDAHHIVHWADGGETKLENTLLLCRSHHRRVHEGGYQVCSDRDGQVVFFTPQGKVLFEVPQLPELPPDPVEALVRGNRERGVTPDWRSGAPRWNRDRDIPWAIEAAAMEAIDPWDEPAA
ncbi:MAG: HNH endonuclease, partial [Gemmatimonadetes bacterium]|nr:HNH endonuclease [Gemmatimonadota bacterium]